MIIINGIKIYKCPCCKHEFPEVSNSAPHKDGALCFQCYISMKRAEGDINMSSKIALKTFLMVTGINKKSQAKVFKDLKMEDTISLSLPIEGHGSYAPPVEVKNLRTGDTIIKSVNELKNILPGFDFIEVKE